MPSPRAVWKHWSRSARTGAVLCASAERQSRSKSISPCLVPVIAGNLARGHMELLACLQTCLSVWLSLSPPECAPLCWLLCSSVSSTLSEFSTSELCLCCCRVAKGSWATALQPALVFVAARCCTGHDWVVPFALHLACSVTAALDRL